MTICFDVVYSVHYDEVKRTFLTQTKALFHNLLLLSFTELPHVSELLSSQFQRSDTKISLKYSETK